MSLDDYFTIHRKTDRIRNYCHKLNHAMNVAFATRDQRMTYGDTERLPPIVVFNCYPPELVVTKTKIANPYHNYNNTVLCNSATFIIGGYKDPKPKKPKEAEYVDIKIEVKITKSGGLSIIPGYQCNNKVRYVTHKSIDRRIKDWYSPKLFVYKINKLIIVSNNEKNAIDEYLKVEFMSREKITITKIATEKKRINEINQYDYEWYKRVDRRRALVIEFLEKTTKPLQYDIQTANYNDDDFTLFHVNIINYRKNIKAIIIFRGYDNKIQYQADNKEFYLTDETLFINYFTKFYNGD